MVTTTTKTLNYSITKGNTTNSVNATITSTPGFNSNYLGKVPGILKIVELILAVVALALVASLVTSNYRPVIQITTPKADPNATTTVAPHTIRTTTPPTTTVAGQTTTTLTPDQEDARLNLEAYNRGLDRNGRVLSYPHEFLMSGEVYFLCAHSVVISVLVIVLDAYLFHTTSAMIIPKATTLENVANVFLALLLIAAGITEIVMTAVWTRTIDWTRSVDDIYGGHPEFNYKVGGQPIMDNEPIRYAAGAIAILNGLLFIGSFVLSRKELAGPKTL